MPRGIPYGPGQLFSGGNSSPKLKCFLPIEDTPNQTWVLSETGVWRFYAWGTGGANNYLNSAYYGAASGGLSVISKFLSAGESVAIELSPTRTRLVFPDASAIQILAATIGSFPIDTPVTGKGGIASGGEININGTDGVIGNANGLPGGGTDGGLGGTANGNVPGGAGAPGVEGIRGGNGLRYRQSTSGGQMAAQRGAGRGFPGSDLNFPVANSGEVIALKVG